MRSEFFLIIRYVFIRKFLIETVESILRKNIYWMLLVRKTHFSRIINLLISPVHFIFCSQLNTYHIISHTRHYILTSRPFFFSSLSILILFWQLKAKYEESELTVQTLVRINHAFRDELNDGLEKYSYSPRSGNSVSQWSTDFGVFSFFNYVV